MNNEEVKLKVGIKMTPILKAKMKQVKRLLREIESIVEQVITSMQIQRAYLIT